MRTRECPIKGCAAIHDRSKLMCLAHWRRVPRPLKDELWRAYREDGVLSEEYQQARDACISYVED